MTTRPAKLLDRRLFHRGDVVFREGDDGDAGYLIQSGAVGIFKELDGESVQLATLHKGQVFGEMAVIDKTKRMATAVVIEDAVVVRISQKSFDEKLARIDTFVKAIITVLLRNLRSVHEAYIKRPRSFMDFVKMVGLCSDNLLIQVRHVQYDGDHAELASKIAAVHDAVQELKLASQRVSDRRNDAISSDDIKPPSKRETVPLD